MSWTGCSSVCRFLTHSDFDLETNPSTYQAVTDQERLLPFRVSLLLSTVAFACSGFGGVLYWLPSRFLLCIFFRCFLRSHGDSVF